MALRETSKKKSWVSQYAPRRITTKPQLSATLEAAHARLPHFKGRKMAQYFLEIRIAIPERFAKSLKKSHKLINT